MASNNESKRQPRKGLERILFATVFSIDGIRSAFKLEEAFRQEVYRALVLTVVAVILPVGLTAKAILLGSVFLVLIVELLNSGLETTIDYISSEEHPYAKRVKDMGSAAVLLSLVNLCAHVGTGDHR